MASRHSGGLGVHVGARPRSGAHCGITVGAIHESPISKRYAHSRESMHKRAKHKLPHFLKPIPSKRKYSAAVTEVQHAAKRPCVPKA